MNSSTEHIVMPDKSFRSFSVFVLQWNISRDQSALISNAAVSINIIFGVCLYLYVSYPAWKSHLFCAALYCRLLPVCLYYIVINGAIFGKKDLECKMCFFSSATFVWNIFRSKKNSARYHKCICLQVQYPLPLSDFKSTGIFSKDFRKLSNIKFRENPLTGGRVILCWQTDGRADGHDEANRRFSQFWYASNKYYAFHTQLIYMKWFCFITLLLVEVHATIRPLLLHLSQFDSKFVRN
jgi:hypothetical protein